MTSISGVRSAKGCSAVTRSVRSVPSRATPRSSTAAPGGKEPDTSGRYGAPSALPRDEAARARAASLRARWP